MVISTRNCTEEHEECYNIPAEYTLYYVEIGTFVLLMVFYIIANRVLTKRLLKSKEKIKNNKYKLIMMYSLLFICITLIFTETFIFKNTQEQSGCEIIPRYCGGIRPDVKPIIYLYPEQKQDVYVKLDYKGEIFADYPEYNDEIKGWKVNADIDGTITNYADQKEYSYLFWEGNPDEEINWDLSTGFVVKGTESREFLQEILPKVGLTPKEYNEFIVYWYPIMQKNKYNLIHFAGKQYTNYAVLETTPKYDSILRVFMILKPLEEKIDIKAQEFTGFKRNGFTVVEWGGTILK